MEGDALYEGVKPGRGKAEKDPASAALLAGMGQLISTGRVA